MSDDPKYHVTYSASDGRTWTEPMPERVRRELDACRAIDVLHDQVGKMVDPVQAATNAVAAASDTMPATQLLAEWAHHTAALIAVIDDLTKASTDTITAVRRAFWLEKNHRHEAPAPFGRGLFASWVNSAFIAHRISSEPSHASGPAPVPGAMR